MRVEQYISSNITVLCVVILLYDDYTFNPVPTHWVTVTQIDFQIPTTYTTVLSGFFK